jgi:hypothetical protein
MLNELLSDANGHVLVGQHDEAIDAIASFAEIVFDISPFIPKPYPDNWKAILAGWLRGTAMIDIGATSEDALRFVEGGLIYSLPWAMEAVRVRAIANDDILEDGFLMGDVELGLAVGAVETGTLNISASLLMRAGFNSRAGAIKAVADGNGDFRTFEELRDWLAADIVKDLAKDSSWPSVETHSLWTDFVASLTPKKRQRWRRQEGTIDVEWDDDLGPYSPTPLQIAENNEGDLLVLDAFFTRYGTVTSPLEPYPQGLFLLTASDENDEADYLYYGPKDLGL